MLPWSVVVLLIGWLSCGAPVVWLAKAILACSSVVAASSGGFSHSCINLLHIPAVVPVSVPSVSMGVVLQSEMASFVWFVKVGFIIV